MAPITVSEDKLNKVLADVETLVEDVSSLLNQDETVKKRLQELKENPSLAKSEKDLNGYLKKRGLTLE